MAKGSYFGVNLATADLDGTFAKLEASGAEVVQEPTEQPYGVRNCAFRDPAGNLVRIQEAALTRPSGQDDGQVLRHRRGEGLHGRAEALERGGDRRGVLPEVVGGHAVRGRLHRREGGLDLLTAGFRAAATEVARSPARSSCRRARPRGR